MVQPGCAATGARADVAAGGTAGAAATLLPGFDRDKGQYVLPDLPYAHNALEPHIDEQTMRLHHGAHHAAYVRGLNAALENLRKAREADDFGLVKHYSREVSFHGGGHALHTIFWANMAPASNGGGGEPEGELRNRINDSFGSFEKMKSHFSAAAAAVEGGGWGLMVHDLLSDRLLVIQGENQQKLTTWAAIPVLTLDVWEHAYYLKYQNRRALYIENWWNVVNWSDVARRVG
ncbi:MAG: superoxide dismutase [Phycisphaeraceae bacterium]|nr:superoxide dismutase [Phycisphaeraceae bacterium]